MEEKERNIIHLLLDKAMNVKQLTNHYVHMDYGGSSGAVSIRVQEGPFDFDEDYSLKEDFDSGKIVGSKRVQRTLDYLDSLLPQEEVQ